MRIQVPSASRILVLLLFSVVGLVAICAFFYVRLDAVVHSDLYRFGLQFSPEWAESYRAYSRLILGSLTAAALVNFATASYSLASHIGRTSRRRGGVAALLLIGICAAVSSAVFFTRLDMIVHGSLYQFGLQFSEEWAIPYWTNARLFLGLIGLLVAVDCVSLVGAVSAGSVINVSSERLVSVLMLLAGGAALLLALIYESSIFTFVGLGFILWGVVMLYAGSKRYVEESMVRTLIFPLLTDLDRFVQDLGCKGKAFFLPPRYLSDFETCRMYISAEESGDPPQPEHIRGKENTVLLRNPAGLMIEPPGAELSRLLEKKLNVKFARVDLRFLQRELPKAFAEKLQLAKSVEMDVEEDRIRVTIDDFTIRDVCEKVRSLTHVYGKIGSPVTSAIGCALAKASGELVVVDKEIISQNDRNIMIEYRIYRSA